MDDLRAGPLERAYDDYQVKQRQLDTLIVENPDVFRAFFEVMEARNEALERTRTLMREGEYDNLGPFRRTRTQKKTVDPDLLRTLAPHTVQLDGLYEMRVEINKPVLEGYLAEGRITREELEASTIVEESTARIYGPKPISGL